MNRAEIRGHLVDMLTSKWDTDDGRVLASCSCAVCIAQSTNLEVEHWRLSTLDEHGVLLESSVARFAKHASCAVRKTPT